MIPVISGCPGNIMETTTLEQRQCFTSWTEPQVSDNSGVVSLLDQTHFSNSLFAEGVTTVTYTYVDPTGNQASCSFQVTCTPGKSSNDNGSHLQLNSFKANRPEHKELKTSNSFEVLFNNYIYIQLK